MRRILIFFLFLFFCNTTIMEAYDGEIYKSEEFAFQVKIPDGWKKVDRKDTPLRLQLDKKIITVNINQNENDVHFERFTKSEIDSILSYYTANIDLMFTGYKVTKSGESVINGYKYLWVLSNDRFGTDAFSYIVSGKRFLYTIIIQGNHLSDKDIKLRDEFLISFSFL